MDPKEKIIEDKVEHDEKEKKILSMNSAMQRLQSLTQKQETSKMSTDAKAETNIKNTTDVSTENSIEINYELDKDELNPSLLDENILTEQEDAKKNKKFAWLAYILFFIPLLINRKSPFVRLHANEGLDVFIIDVLAGIMIACGKLISFPTSSAIIGHLLVLFGIGLFILTTITKIFQIIRVLLGKKNQTPWLWKTRIIK